MCEWQGKGLGSLGEGGVWGGSWVEPHSLGGVCVAMGGHDYISLCRGRSVSCEDQL